jgi:hypothetical protein
MILDQHQDDSGSGSDTEDKADGEEDEDFVKAEEVPLPESPVKTHISPATPWSIQTDLPVANEVGGGRTSDEAPPTAVPGRVSLDNGDETEKESNDGHEREVEEGHAKEVKESEVAAGKKKVDVISAALDSLPE